MSGESLLAMHLNSYNKWRSFPSAMVEEVFFAGYCGPEFSYTWVSNEEISVVCGTDVSEGLQTVTSLFQGIKVRVEVSPGTITSTRSALPSFIGWTYKPPTAASVIHINLGKRCGIRNRDLG